MSIALNWFAGLVSALLAFALPLAIRPIDRVLLAVACYPPIFFLADEIGAPRAYPASAAGVLSCLTALAIAIRVALRIREAVASKAPPTAAASAKSALLAAGACLALLFQYLPTHVLPDHDPIAVQVFAKAVAKNHSAIDPPFAPDDVFASYPPGYPILFAPIFLEFSALDAAVLFKHLSLLIVALTPLIWASYSRRIFDGRVSAPVAVLAWYAAFFCLDRTIGYTQPLAGKNALLLAGLLFPFAFSLFAECRRSIWHFFAASLALYGLFLVHYSAAYMVTICALVYVATRCGAPWRHPAGWLAYAAPGVLALGLFLPVLLRLLADPPEFATRSAISAPNALLALGEHLFAPFSNVVFIFHDRESIAPWPFKNVVLLLLFAGSLAIRRRFAWSPAAQGVLDMTRVFGGAWLLGLILASGIIPHAGISSDYVRWFLFYFQAGIFAGALQILWLAWREGHLKIRAPRAWLALAVAAALLVSGLDYVRQFAVIAKRRYAETDLAQLDRLLAPYSRDGACFVVAPSRALNATGAHFIYGPNALDYTPILSDCRLVTGGWVSRPLPGGRNLGNLPDAETLARLAAEGSVLFFGHDAQLRRYQHQVPGIEFRRLRNEVGTLSVWRALPSVSR